MIVDILDMTKTNRKKKEKQKERKSQSFSSLQSLSCSDANSSCNYGNMLPGITVGRR
jgi:hypothetical protein